MVGSQRSEPQAGPGQGFRKKALMRFWISSHSALLSLSPLAVLFLLCFFPFFFGEYQQVGLWAGGCLRSFIGGEAEAWRAGGDGQGCVSGGQGALEPPYFLAFLDLRL